jgi:polyhydroxyalkanoate synthesis regulator phasin
MSEAIIVAIITGGLALIGTLVATKRSNSATMDKVMNEMKTAQAVTDTLIAELTREVREHNNFAKRVPVLEEKIKAVNKRIDDLETEK